MRPTVTMVLAAAVAMAMTAPAAARADRSLIGLRALADKGSVLAQFEVAGSYEAGKGVRRNARLAFAYYCRAARSGHAEAAYRAGQMHMAGHGGVKADAALGAAWIRRAVWLGFTTGGAGPAPASGAEPAAPKTCGPPNAGWTAIRMPPAKVRAIVAKLAPRYQLDPDLVLAVIAAESGYRVDAVSPKNAMGLMQLIPETATRFGVQDPFDPEQNIRGGMKYLRWLLAHFDGDVALALAGYNAGEGAVAEHKGIPPYRETRNYVLRIQGIYGPRHHPFDRSVARSAGLSPTKEQVAELSFPSAAGQPKSASIDD